ncbi:MAG: hypothetical protein U9Q89_05360 [Thermodesulfobacteriota bacterium]|nr:hypothetical protein [Thermodesulfobacteriota bacterium]
MAAEIEIYDDVIKFGITTLPGKKRPCLFLSRGGELETLAYFTSDENAEKFKIILDHLVDGFSSLHSTTN